MHSIQTTLQILLQACSALSVSLLWSWILGAPPSTSRNRHSWSLVRTYLAGLDSYVLSESRYLVQDHLAHLSYILDNLEVEVEGGGTSWLV
jgi:hypothetical protein